MQKSANSKAQSASASIYGECCKVKYRIQIVRKQNSDTPRALQFMVRAGKQRNDYNQYRVRIATFRARPTFGGREPHRRVCT